MQIPTKIIGPILIKGDVVNDSVKVPLSTFETTIWPSVSRGAKISRLVGGINTTFISENMTRSILLESDDVKNLVQLRNSLIERKEELENVVAQTSRFAKLKDMYFEIVSTLIFIRFSFATGEAAGHNMTTKASDAIIKWICDNFENIKYVSVSGNMCVDKKVSAINGILGRGKNIIAEIIIPENICEEVLHVKPKNIVDLNNKKNLLGSILAGSIRSANAHYANMLLACYLATGQDAANIIEGSQGITYAEVKDDGSLYFSVNCTNLIVGTIGNGKELEDVRENLETLGCLNNENKNGENSRRLATIITATVLCGELSLLAAQVNFGSLTKAHEKYERKQF